jgi:hypothetical protein
MDELHGADCCDESLYSLRGCMNRGFDELVWLYISVLQLIRRILQRTLEIGEQGRAGHGVHPAQLIQGQQPEGAAFNFLQPPTWAF